MSICLCVQVLEPRFNVETMALLLNIPPNKTLLRRHLATHFNLLVGTEAQQMKQECMENPDYTLLTATAKVKVQLSSHTTGFNCLVLHSCFISSGQTPIFCFLY